MNRPRPAPRRGALGFSMIEVLVTMVIVAFGLLGLAGFVTRANAVSVESNQRARALALMEDMAERIRNNKSQANNYVSADVVHGEAAIVCGAAVGAARDLCEWNNVLFGTNDALTNGGAQTLRFRGCVIKPFLGQEVFVVTVAWGSLVAGTPPADGCAADAFGDDAYRRVVRTQVRVATLAL